MTSVGAATTDGVSLEVRWLDQLWMTIRRADGGKDAGFADFDGRKMVTDDIGDFLPNWRTLSWSKMQDSDLSHGQWAAHEGDYRINIYGEPGGAAWHGEVMDSYWQLARDARANSSLINVPMMGSLKRINGSSAESGHRFERLLEQVNLIVAQSGVHTGFDSRRWLTEWLELPLAALDGEKPADYMATEAGIQLVLSLLAQMQSGAYV